MNQLIIPALSAFILNMILTHCIIKLALKYHWYDTINDRKIHSGNIPRLGGVGIFLSFLFSFSIFYFILNRETPSGVFANPDQNAINLKLFALYFSVFVIFLIGLIDDFSELKAKVKFVIQVAIAITLVSAGFIFKEITIPFTQISITASWICYPLTFFWYIGVINAVNLIDGMDGLSGGTSFLSAIFFAIVGIIIHDFFLSYICFIFASSLLAFLFFNFPPAKIFMGDCGSLFLGTLLAIFPTTIRTEGSSLQGWALPIALLILIVPIFDTISAIFRRVIIKRVHFFNPDKEHLHHKLLAMGLSSKKALFVIYNICLTGGLFGLAIVKQPHFASIILTIAICFFIILFSIISLLYHKKRKASA